MEQKLTEGILLVLFFYCGHRIMKGLPAAFRFGVENRETIKGGLSFIKRFLGK